MQLAVTQQASARGEGQGGGGGDEGSQRGSLRVSGWTVLHAHGGVMTSGRHWLPPPPGNSFYIPCICLALPMPIPPPSHPPPLHVWLQSMRTMP